MNPKITGTRITSIWIEMPPWRALLFFGLRFLVTTWPHKVPCSLAILVGLGRNVRQECRWELWHRRFFSGLQRLDKMRRHQHKEFRIGLLGGPAAEQLPQNRDTADARHFIDRFSHSVVDQPGNGKALAIFQDHLSLCTALRKRRDQESLQSNGIGVIERTHLR